MAKAKITITGEVEKFKVNEDGTVNIIIKADTSKGVPSGLKELRSSTYSIAVSQKMWKKVSDKFQGNRILFTGEPKAAVTVKGVPFTLVNCFDISVIEQQNKEPNLNSLSELQVREEKALAVATIVSAIISKNTLQTGVASDRNWFSKINNGVDLYFDKDEIILYDTGEEHTGVKLSWVIDYVSKCLDQVSND